MAVVQLRADRTMHASKAGSFWRRWVWLASLFLCFSPHTWPLWPWPLDLKFLCI